MRGCELMPQFNMKGMLFSLIVGLLVCCVVMQMVGIRASLGDSSHIADNSVESSILAASALVTVQEAFISSPPLKWKTGFAPSLLNGCFSLRSSTLPISRNSFFFTDTRLHV